VNPALDVEARFAELNLPTAHRITVRSANGGRN
jgi:hypothetical protein